MVLVPEEEAVPGVPVLEVAALVVQAEDKAGRADNQVQVDRVVRAAAAPAVRAAQAVEAAPAEVAAAREAALVQAEAAAVPAVAGKTDKLFFNINKSDSRRIAFVLLQRLENARKTKKN